MQHPDPWRYQLGVVAELYQNLQDVVWVFVDFISLYQYRRNDSQDSSFRKALDRMHMLYSHEMVQVDILEDLTPEKMKVDGTLFVYDPTEDAMKWVPITSLKLNQTPHALRGWCQAEKEWARLRMMLTAMGIPTPPEIFRQRMGQMKFTHRDDAEQVFQLQAKVFQEKISGTTHLHLERLSAQDLEALHEALPYYQKLQFVVVNGIRLHGRDAVVLVQSGAHDVQMESCQLQDEDAILIAEALVKDKTDRLRVLSLTGNGLLVNFAGWDWFSSFFMTFQLEISVWNPEISCLERATQASAKRGARPFTKWWINAQIWRFPCDEWVGDWRWFVIDTGFESMLNGATLGLSFFVPSL